MTRPGNQDQPEPTPAAAQTLGDIADAMREALDRQDARGYRDDTAVIDHTNAVLEARARDRRNAAAEAATGTPGWPEEAHRRADELFATGRYASWGRAYRAAYDQVTDEHQTRLQERVLAAAAELDPADDSLQAHQLRETAESIRDHRDDAARRSDPADGDTPPWDEPPSRDAARWSPGDDQGASAAASDPLARARELATQGMREVEQQAAQAAHQLKVNATGRRRSTADEPQHLTRSGHIETHAEGVDDGR